MSLRYLILIILGLGNLAIIYAILAPITLYSTNFVLNLFSSFTIQGTSLISSQFTIDLVSACIAGAAYYLLIILNLSTPIPIKTRFKALAFSIILFFIVNVTRITIFAYLYSKGLEIFNALHEITWYAGSIVIIVLIWLTTTSIFNIKSIPFYSDIISIKKISR